MEIAAARKELVDIMTKVLLSIPVGFIFDEVYIIQWLAAEYPDEYLKFCSLYADRQEPMETAIDAIREIISQFEDLLIEKQNLEIHFPTLYSYLSSCGVWKKI